MKRTRHLIECEKFYEHAKRRKPFITIEYCFSYSEDKDLVDKLLEDAKKLHDNVCPKAANDSVHDRNTNVIMANCIAGVFSEYCWALLLNTKGKYVETTDFSSAATQIDLRVIRNNRRIEVRSSFPRNGVVFSVCHPQFEFDILGPYANEYKPGEISKDYYVRALFPAQYPTDIISKVKSESFSVFLAGGATCAMMNDPKIAITKSLVPEDAFYQEIKTEYKVVPYHNALDCKEMYYAITED